MTSIARTLLASGALVTLMASPASAEDAVTKPITLSGFVDTSIFFPLSGFPDGADGVLLGVDQVELDVSVQWMEGLLIRTDLNFFPAADVERFDDIVEQAFVDVTFTNGLFIVAGKTNAPIGVEAVDPTDMLQFSHGLLFSFASPTNLTGFFAGWSNDAIKAMAWVTNDWDTPSTAANASVGGRLQADIGAGTAGVSTTYGPAAADANRLMVDVDVALAFGDLSLFVEGNFITADDGAGNDGSSIGALLKANYAFGDGMSATARVSWLDFEDFDPQLKNAMEVTGAFLFAITDHVGGLVEIRADIRDEADTQIGAAFELTATY